MLCLCNYCGPLSRCQSAQLTANSGLFASGQAGKQAPSPFSLHLQTARPLTKARLEFNLNFIDFGPSLSWWRGGQGEKEHRLTLRKPSLGAAISSCQLVCACLRLWTFVTRLLLNLNLNSNEDLYSTFGSTHSLLLIAASIHYLLSAPCAPNSSWPASILPFSVCRLLLMLQWTPFFDHCTTSFLLLLSWPSFAINQLNRGLCLQP